MHKSQGFGVARARGPAIEYFKVLAEAATPPPPKPGKRSKTPKAEATDGLFAGVDLTWERFGGTKRAGGGARVATLTAAAARGFEVSAPHKSIPALLAVASALDTAVDADADWREQKRREVDALIWACAGLFVDATAADYRAAPGTDVEVTVSALNRSSTPLMLDQVRLPGGRTVTVGKPLVTGAPYELKQSLRVPATLALSTPYWLESAPEAGLYRVADPRLIGVPEGEPPLRVQLFVSVGGAGGRRLTIERAVAFKWTDQVAGELYRPLEVTPAVSVRPAAAVMLFEGSADKTLDVELIAGAAGAEGVLRAQAAAGWTVTPALTPFTLGAPGSSSHVTLRLRPSAGAAPAALKLTAEVGGVPIGRGVVRIEHPHIPIQTYLVDADVRLVPVALATGGRRIGYLPGPGDEVPAALRGVGYDVTVLSDAALAGGVAALARFDAVVVGVRAFNTNERLRAAHATLMGYVEGGGTLVVQYNTNNRLAPLSTPLGPWPFEIGQKRVTDETAAVTFASATHPALTVPNRLGTADFEGWVQERGLYFADTWDARYERPLAMSDPGEAPLAGGVLWTRHGKGTFIYTGLAFFRQLPAGVPGAFRLFANLLAGGRAHGP